MPGGKHTGQVTHGRPGQCGGVQFGDNLSPAITLVNQPNHPPGVILYQLAPKQLVVTLYLDHLPLPGLGLQPGPCRDVDRDIVADAIRMGAPEALGHPDKGRLCIQLQDIGLDFPMFICIRAPVSDVSTFAVGVLADTSSDSGAIIDALFAP